MGSPTRRNRSKKQEPKQGAATGGGGSGAAAQQPQEFGSNAEQAKVVASSAADVLQELAAEARRVGVDTMPPFNPFQPLEDGYALYEQAKQLGILDQIRPESHSDEEGETQREDEQAAEDPQMPFARLLCEQDLRLKPADYKIIKPNLGVLCHTYALGLAEAPSSPEAVEAAAGGKTIAVCFENGEVGHTAVKDGDLDWRQVFGGSTPEPLVDTTDAALRSIYDAVLVHAPGRRISQEDWDAAAK